MLQVKGLARLRATVVIDYTCNNDRSIDVDTARTVATFDGETRDLLFDYIASL